MGRAAGAETLADLVALAAVRRIRRSEAAFVRRVPLALEQDTFEEIGRGRAQETVRGGLRRAQPPAHLVGHRRVVGGQGVEEARPLALRQGRRLQHQAIDPEARAGIHQLSFASDLGPLPTPPSLPLSTRAPWSQVRTARQSRTTVGRETPSTSAVSSTVKPEK